MAVTFTPNIGLAKPTESELAKEWAQTGSSKLCEDNNLIIVDKTDINVITFTPTLIATTTAPTVGAGSRRIEYNDVQGIVFGSFIIDFLDPGITSGSGEYGISLPFPVDGTFHSVGTNLTGNAGQFSVVGEGYIYDASAIATSGAIALDVATIAGVSYLRMTTEVFTAPAKTSRFVRDAMPYTLAHQDRWSGNFIYKRV